MIWEAEVEDRVKFQKFRITIKTEFLFLDCKGYILWVNYALELPNTSTFFFVQQNRTTVYTNLISKVFKICTQV